MCDPQDFFLLLYHVLLLFLHNSQKRKDGPSIFEDDIFWMLWELQKALKNLHKKIEFFINLLMIFLES
jgi:hypothetical protein